LCFFFCRSADLQAKYGTIVKYKWFGDGYIMIGN